MEHSPKNIHKAALGLAVKIGLPLSGAITGTQKLKQITNSTKREIILGKGK